MNVLFLTPQLPYPPRQGTALRNWGLISGLARRHRVSLLSFSDDVPSTSLHRVLTQTCESVTLVPTPNRRLTDRLRQLASPLPDLAWRIHSPALLQTLADMNSADHFDVIHVEALELGRALLHLRELARGRRPMLLYDAHNAEQLIQQRALATDRTRPARWHAALYSSIQIPRLRSFERRVLRAADRVTCVSAEDAASLRELVPGLAPVIVPNGLDLHSYTSQAWPAAEGLGEFAIVFTGKMDYRPNVDAAEWFAAQMLPAIQARRPEAQFVIVGQKPSPRLLALGERPGVVVTGAVEDVRPFIARAAVFVAPLRMGGGTRFKLLEAMALGTPIVSTHVGAEGFDVASGRELLLADSPADFVEAVLSLSRVEGLRRDLTEAALRFVRANYDWEAIIPRVEAAWSEAGDWRRGIEGKPEVGSKRSEVGGK